MTNQRLTQLASEARSLAAAVTTAVSGKGAGEWMYSLRGFLQMYFPGGNLDPYITTQINDPKKIGQIISISQWLQAKTSAISTADVPITGGKLTTLAKILEQASTNDHSDEDMRSLPGATPTSTNTERFGKWVILSDRLGRGGQGEVTLVYDAFNLQRGALKRMSGRRAASDKGRERFFREIDAFKRIRHPFVVSILDAAESPEPYLVTELAEFGSLHDNKVAFKGDIWRCLRLARSIALGLHEAHNQGIVHRDIKPKNILLHSLDHPVVGDFGIAHFEDKDTITSLGSHPAAWKFAPPEYEYDEEPTPAFDVFSLGAVMHWAILDEPSRPYRSHSKLPSIATSTNNKRYRVVDDLIAHMTQKEITRRLQSMAETVAHIDNVCEQLFGRSYSDPDACSCGTGVFKALGSIHLGPGTEINIYSGNTTHDGFGLGMLAPSLEKCNSCGQLRLRAAN